MARIEPFRPFRYTPAAGPLDKLVTQPYDKISPAKRTEYLAQSPYNPVRIILGESSDADTPADNVYTRAAGYLNSWISEGILAQDPEPGFYPYFQEFDMPDTGERVVRKGFIGLGPAVDYSEGIVHRHEQTLSGPKKDRMELLRATHAHYGQLFMLYPDPEGAVDAILDQAASAEPLARVGDEYGATHSLWRMSDPEQVNAVRALMDTKKLLIADGHHRYETALAFRRENPDWKAAERVMMTFVNMHTTGLKILATHRVVRGVNGLDAETLASKLAALGRVTPLDSADQLKARWAEPADNEIRIGVAAGDRLFLLQAPRAEGQLDVTYLHQQILDGALGIGEEAVRDQKHLTYVRGLENAVEGVTSGDAQAAFLLEPTSVQQVADVSFSGGVMPQKSTDFFPKLLSGMTIYKLD